MRHAAPNGSDGIHSYAEFDALCKDIETLKADFVALSGHLKADGRAKAAEVKGTVDTGINALLDKSEDGLELLEAQVKENPRRALIVAFCAGLALNFLMRKG